MGLLSELEGDYILGGLISEPEGGLYHGGGGLIIGARGGLYPGGLIIECNWGT